MFLFVHTICPGQANSFFWVHIPTIPLIDGTLNPANKTALADCKRFYLGYRPHACNRGAKCRSIIYVNPCLGPDLSVQATKKFGGDILLLCSSGFQKHAFCALNQLYKYVVKHSPIPVAKFPARWLIRTISHVKNHWKFGTVISWSRSRIFGNIPQNHKLYLTSIAKLPESDGLNISCFLSIHLRLFLSHTFLLPSSHFRLHPVSENYNVTLKKCFAPLFSLFIIGQSCLRINYI